MKKDEKSQKAWKAGWRKGEDMHLTRLLKLEQGFTLVEILVAFALLGLVITALYSFYFTGLQAWNRSVERMENQQTARISMDKMISELQYAHLVKLSINQDSQTTGEPGDIIYFRTYINGISARYSFRLEGTQLHLDRRRDTNNSVRYTSLVALGVTDLEFIIDSEDTVFIEVTAGEGSGKVTLNGAVKPRNIPRVKPDLLELLNRKGVKSDQSA